MITVEIPSTTEVATYQLYNIELQVQSNVGDSLIKVSKRFSDFVEFKKNLESELNETISYRLPSRVTFMKQQDALIKERKIALCEFLSGILNDEKIRSNRIVLNFLNLPASTFAEINSDKIKFRNENLLQSGNNVVVVDSSQKWLDVLREAKSLLQDIRSKLFSNLNLIDCKKKLNLVKVRLDTLENYLDTANEFIGAGELKRRKDTLATLYSDYNDLSSLTVGLRLNSNQVSQRDTITKSEKDDLFKSNSGSGSRRVLGKPKETDFTKQYNSKELLQQEQVLMDKQDQSLDSLRLIIQRQRQIGTAINEELAIQNDLLHGLNDQVDSSQSKMNNAKQKIDRIS